MHTRRHIDSGPPTDSARNGRYELAPDLSVLRLTRPSPPALPLEIFGDCWAQWIMEAAEAAACPVDYVVAALLPAASALIGNSRWAQAWPGWQEPPHLWCAAVGHSGQGKSPGADVILRHVVPSIEAHMVRDCGFKEDVQLALLRAHASAFPAKDVILPAAAFADFPTEPRFMESDLTIEKVADVLSNAAPKGLLMVRDELAGMNRFNAGARAFWLEAYGGRPYSLDRIKSAGRIYVPRLAVAWHGGVQPSRLTKLLTDADDGLLARFLWFWPEPVPFRRPKTAPNLEFAISAFERLSLLEMGPAAPLRSKDGHERIDNAADTSAPITVRLAEEAAIQLEAFACQIQDRQFQSTGLINSALGKIRGIALRLSLVLAYLRWAADDGIAPAPSEIGIEALCAATRLVSEYLIPMAQRVYGDITLSPAHHATETLARWIIQTEAAEVHVRQIQRHERLPGLVTALAIHKACGALVTAGWLIPPPRGSNHGRAKQAYRLRPEMRRMLSCEHQHP